MFNFRDYRNETFSKRTRNWTNGKAPWKRISKTSRRRRPKIPATRRRRRNRRRKDFGTKREKPRALRRLLIRDDPVDRRRREGVAAKNDTDGAHVRNREKERVGDRPIAAAAAEVDILIAIIEKKKEAKIEAAAAVAAKERAKILMKGKFAKRTSYVRNWVWLLCNNK